MTHCWAVLPFKINTQTLGKKTHGGEDPMKKFQAWVYFVEKARNTIVSKSKEMFVLLTRGHELAVVVIM